MKKNLEANKKVEPLSWSTEISALAISTSPSTCMCV